MRLIGAAINRRPVAYSLPHWRTDVAHVRHNCKIVSHLRNQKLACPLITAVCHSVRRLPQAHSGTSCITGGNHFETRSQSAFGDGSQTWQQCARSGCRCCYLWPWRSFTTARSIRILARVTATAQTAAETACSNASAIQVRTLPVLSCIVAPRACAYVLLSVKLLRNAAEH